MEISDRIKQLRNELELKQEDFGKRINLTKFAISNYENNRTGIPDRVISDICREFNASESWLRTGKGDIFIKIPEEDETAALVSELLEDDGDNAFYGLIKDVMKAYDKLSPNSKKVVEELCTTVYENQKRRNN